MMVMPTLQIVLFLLCFLCGTSFCFSLSRSNSQIGCNTKDREILLQFKKGVVDPSNLLSSWSKEEDCCKWIGVQCHNMTGRVTKLDLYYHFINHHNNSYKKLTGEINLCVLQLDFLSYLDLSHNNFTAINDSENCRLRSHNLSLLMPQHQNANISTLCYLDISWNDDLKIDNFRWLSHIPLLKYLNLSGIDLHRKNDCLHSISTLLPSLLELRLENCQLGPVNSFQKYVHFTSLTILDLSSNTLNSKVFEWVSNISDSISYLDLSLNYIDSAFDIPLNFQSLKYLYLSANKLSGTIPKWLGLYKNLQELDLSENSFHGSIPLELGNLSFLQVLYLSHNSVHGSIPIELGNLSSLIYLDISYNQLSGSLPETLHKLSSLETLNVAGNSMGGVISESNFANLTNLKLLDLSSSVFQFNVNSDWTPPFQLVQLHLESCLLGPEFPTWIYTQSILVILQVPSTGISVIDHDKFWSFASNIIGSLDISNNSFSGDISNLVINTMSVGLTSNKFSGVLPRITTYVEEFFAGDNNFSGSISHFLCGPKNAKYNYLGALDLSNNHLSGELPNCWMNWDRLFMINLASNNFTGSIPPSMGSLSSLEALFLYDNNLLGDIPLSLQQCNRLRFLDLAGNKLSGNIPSWMAQSTVAMSLRGNEFSGNIPQEICHLSSLAILDLSDNSLSGSIPQCFSNLTSMKNGYAFINGHALVKPSVDLSYYLRFDTKGQELKYKIAIFNCWQVIDLSKNNLVGSIPSELFYLVKLVSLNLSQNHLTGKIPPEIGQMKELESLDLSINYLSGEIPQAISRLTFLEYLNLSFNNFSGRIPTGTQLQSFNASSFMGNLDLCGDPLKKCTEGKKSVDIVNAKDEDEFLSSFYIGMGVGFAMGFWGVCVALFFNRTLRHAYFRFLDDLKAQFSIMELLIRNYIH